MPKQLSKSSPRYTVWSNGATHTGTAEEILESIQDAARQDSVIRELSPSQYAEALIDSAPYHFPDGIVPELLAARQFPSKFDEALEYLSVMPASGVRILSRKN